jgi:hypothetical protein
MYILLTFSNIDSHTYKNVKFYFRIIDFSNQLFVILCKANICLPEICIQTRKSDFVRSVEKEVE